MSRKKPQPTVIRAVLQRNKEKVNATVALSSSVNEVDADGRTALHHSVLLGDTSIVGTLLEAHADVGAKDRQGWTPLHYAARDHNTELAELLLAAGADVNAEDVHGNTPLFRAVFESRGRGEMIALLRHHGANVAHRNHHGISITDLAATIANYDVKKWLK